MESPLVTYHQAGTISPSTFIAVKSVKLFVLEAGLKCLSELMQKSASSATGSYNRNPVNPRLKTAEFRTRLWYSFSFDFWEFLAGLHDRARFIKMKSINEYDASVLEQ